jgi:hypothetical protein
MSIWDRDMNGDHLEDALVAIKGMRVLFLKRLDETGLRWQLHEISADFRVGNTRAVAPADINGDGRSDLAITTWNVRGKHGVFWLEFKSSQQLWRAHQLSGLAQGIK